MAISQNFPATRPGLSLNFSRSKVLDPRMIFTRAQATSPNLTTSIGRNGLLTSYAADQPRFDHDLSTGECIGLIIEEQKTNLITNSDIEGTVGSTPTSWNTAYGTSVVSTDYYVGPNGKSVKITKSGATDNNAGYFAYTMPRVSFTGNITNGSTTITNVSSTTGLVVGMVINQQSSTTSGVTLVNNSTTDRTTITAIDTGANTVTISQAATVTATGTQGVGTAFAASNDSKLGSVMTTSMYIYIPSSQVISLTANPALNASAKTLTFNVETSSGGKTTSVTASSADMTKLDQWQRLTINFTPLTGGFYAFVPRLNNGNSNELKTDGVTSAPYAEGAVYYIDAIQLEQESFASSFIPTLSSEVTRGADILYMDDLRWFDKNEGSFVVTYRNRFSGNFNEAFSALWEVRNTSSGRRFTFAGNDNSWSQLYFVDYDVLLATDTANNNFTWLNPGSSSIPTRLEKMFFSYTNSYFRMYINGNTFSSSNTLYGGGTANKDFIPVFPNYNFTGNTTANGNTITGVKGPLGRSAGSSLTISGTGVSGTSGNYNVSTWTTSGSGTGATFYITRSASGVYTAKINSTGSGFSYGDTITISGTELGGASPANDLTMTVKEVLLNVGIMVSSQSLTVPGGTTITGVSQTTSTITLSNNIASASTGTTFTAKTDIPSLGMNRLFIGNASTSSTSRYNCTIQTFAYYPEELGVDVGQRLTK